MQIVVRLGRAAPFLLVMAVGIYLYYVASQFDFVAHPNRAGPDVWPKIVLALMLLACVWGALQALLKPSDGEEMSLLVRAATRAVGREEEARQDLEADAGSTGQRRPLHALGAILALLAFVGCIAYVGFAVATFVLMFAIMLLAGYGRPFVAASISLIGALAFFFVFQRVAYISLPLGVGPFRDLSIWLMAIIGVR
jgi:putative tricarboxylic transport membrane protein